MRRRTGWIVAAVLITALAGAGGAVMYVQWSNDRAYQSISRPAAKPRVFVEARPRFAYANDPPPWANDPAAANLARRVTYLRRAMLTDGYEKAGRRDPRWDDAVRMLINVQVAATCDDPAAAGDDREARIRALDRCYAPHARDMIISYIAGRRDAVARNAAGEIANHIEAAEACAAQPGYPPLIRALALFHGADCGARAPRYDMPARYAAAARQFADDGARLLPEVFADKDLPAEFVELLFEAIGAASVSLEGDRLKLLTEAAKVADRGAVPRAAVLAATGVQFVNYAWDARGGDVAANVSDAQFAEFHKRLGVARVALEKAWQLDPAAAVAPREMIVVCMGLGLPREEMETWYRRAVEADPYASRPRDAKMTYLEPKWHGSADELIAFGRELLKAGRWSTGEPLALIDAHFRLAHYLRRPGLANDGQRWEAYVAADPAVWADAKAAFDGYLRQFPESVYERTRYACVAAWAGQWAEADRQCRLLEDRPSTSFTDEREFLEMRKTALAKVKAAAGGAAAPSTTSPTPK